MTGIFTTQQSYNGPATSAEWVVEAPDAPGLCGGACTLAPYSDNLGSQPGEMFDDMGVTGNESDLYQITMVQGGEAVSTPSPFTASFFDVAYTGTSESPQGVTGGPMQGTGVVGHKLLDPTMG